MAREHNRIVGLLPRALSDETGFQIARRVVGAEEQYVTYGQFLHAFGVKLAPYRGYRAAVDASITNEFATVGYRGHSMVHGNFDISAPAGRWSAAQLASFRTSGIQVDAARGRYLLDVPLDLTFGNPDLLHAIGIGPVLQGLGNEREYRNDEQVDDALRSVLFQVPKTFATSCGDPRFVNPNCFSGVEDLAAIDLERSRDHGIPSYNALRHAYGLPPQTTFAAVTGEREAALPSEPDWIDDPASLQFVSLRSRDGTGIAPGTEQALEDAVSGVRRTALASRLEAIYGDVGRLDAYVGMVSEQHVRGTEFGPLQLAAWKRQFTALRDGDRFFYANDPELTRTRRLYGIDYRATLAQLIGRNTGVTVQADVFKLVR
jgi:peroxidase